MDLPPDKQTRVAKIKDECASPSSNPSEFTLKGEEALAVAGLGHLGTPSLLPVGAEEPALTSSAGTRTHMTSPDRGQGSRPPNTACVGSGRSKYGFRFLAAERETLENWYREHDSATPKIGIRIQWAHKWNALRRAYANEEDSKYKVNPQQIKQWFENTRRRRNAQRKKMPRVEYNLPAGSEVSFPLPQSSIDLMRSLSSISSSSGSSESTAMGFVNQLFTQFLSMGKLQQPPPQS